MTENAATRSPSGSEEPHSAIAGDGYGSSHAWARGKTAQVGAAAAFFKRTDYHCAACGAHFVHPYDLMPNIFEAIELAGVVDRCPR